MEKSVEKNGKPVLAVEAEERLTKVYTRLKAYGDIFMATDKTDSIELDGETLSTIGSELFFMGQTIEAIVHPETDYPDDDL